MNIIVNLTVLYIIFNIIIVCGIKVTSVYNYQCYS